LRRFHDSGTELPARFWVPELLDSYASVTLQRGGALPEPYEHARDAAARIAAVLPLSDPVPCHDDLLTANLIVALGETGAPSRLMLVDWEYAGIGHRLFDLGNLAVNNDFDEIAEQRLLRAYLGREPRARRARRAAADARDVRCARGGLGVVQSTVSELDFDFSAYAARHFERLTRATLGPALSGVARLPRPRELPQRARVVVVGGGVGGTSIAYQLVQRGERDVVLLERRRADERLDIPLRGARRPAALERSR